MERHYIEFLRQKGRRDSKIALRLARSTDSVRSLVRTQSIDLHPQPGRVGTRGLWTPEKVERLKQEWEAGTSARVIADMLGATRNAVIGKAHRMELPVHTNSVFRSDARPKRAKSIRRLKARKPARSSSAPVPAAPPPSALTDPLLIPFAALESFHCRYPVSDRPPHFFCGHAQRRKSAFCAFHHALCYEKPRQRTLPAPVRRSGRNPEISRARAA
jgi:GcrA cell cycle regulator